jgi:hypothetical protein
MEITFVGMYACTAPPRAREESAGRTWRGKGTHRHIPGLGLDDGQGREGAGAERVRDLGGALQEAAVQVEDVAGVGLAAGRAAEQQRHLAVGHGVLGQVIVEDDGVACAVAS